LAIFQGEKRKFQKIHKKIKKTYQQIKKIVGENEECLKSQSIAHSEPNDN